MPRWRPCHDTVSSLSKAIHAPLPTPIDKPLKSALAICESDTHAAMIEALQERGLVEITHVLTTGAFSRLDRLNIAQTRLPAAEQQQPADVWRQTQSLTTELLSDRELLYFQDQGWTSQAVSMAAKARGTRRTLIQDGFLSFDPRRAFGWRKSIWPVSSRLDHLPLQTSRPRLRSFLNNTLYRNNFFGITRPESVLVYGNAMKFRLVHQFGISPKAIHVTGPLLRPEALRDTSPLLAGRENLRVLFLDQCHLRYHRMCQHDWDTRYLPLIKALRQYELFVKLHPSQTEAETTDVLKAAGGHATVLGTNRLPNSLDLSVDVAVTVSSTAFISCLAAGIPVIFCDCGGLDLMPHFAHPLTTNSTSAQQTSLLLDMFLKSQNFPGNTRGESLEDHLYLPKANPFAQVLPK